MAECVFMNLNICSYHYIFTSTFIIFLSQSFFLGFMSEEHKPMVFADRLSVDGRLEDSALCDKVIELSSDGRLDVEVYFKDMKHLPESQVERSVEGIKKLGYDVSFLYKQNVAVIYFNGKH